MTRLTASILRDGTGEMLVRECDRYILAQAIEIADECQRAHVESETRAVDKSGCEWRDLSSVEFSYINSIAESCRYLDARGILIRHPENAQLVRFREQPE